MINGELQYRKAAPDDLKALIELGVAAYGVFNETLGPEQWPLMEKGLRDESKIAQLLADAECFICEHEETIIGMVYYLSSGHPWDVFPADWSYIRLLGVHPRYGGLGIGRTLMQHCLKKAIETDEKILALHTSELMNTARGIYESMGFVRTRDLPMRFGIRYWLYELQLK